MNQLSRYEAAPNVQPSAVITDDFAGELRRYDEHLRDVRGLATGTRRSRCRIVMLFLRQTSLGRSPDVSTLRPDEVRRFLASELDRRRSSSHASQLTVALRSYLRYRRMCGDQVDSLMAVITNPVHWKLASLPRALKSDDVARLLNSFATIRRSPKRGYAIVRCALNMGLRAGEIARLALSDIDWHAGTITLRGTKSLRQDVLPLPVEVGQALADYLQHERPRTGNPAIFIRDRGSPDQTMTSMAVQKVIARACRRIGLVHGTAHALRHTLACRLVENGSSLKDVADVLRHRSLNTTLIYAKLDTPRLSTVPLPWPGSGS